ncbi:calcium-binding mitochondrial carrier protein SCaMC-2-like [Mizuhopecten yessoensis]|uniref:Calcium-binding mitochondrial carrier protein SCaMC-2 n=1 Tax=Mizuhopecten yessoensis TaxID=6573 RepID=A0A210PXD1_MIZYE|nr:calcium-binding mitochondrial carrier protein SCaMC-2-like [Mizuhopecten yessoensis]OWF41122.1 Calcium-binding mitochondrial carrier protein SCaMC-2 [Mizuhopecten yessoensis]
MTGAKGEFVLSAEESKKYQELFNKLDVNSDGRIDIADLTSSLTEMNVPLGQAQEFLKKHDANKDGQIDFAEFLKYVTVHDQQLRLYFKKIDTNQDGTIDASEIQESFRKLGLNIDRDEAEKLLSRMDKDGTLKIDFNEWRNFLLLSPAQNIHDMLHYWRHASIIDIGENTIVPDDFTEKEMKTGMWWRHLVAGGAAGAVSRTCTAPLDRLKVLLQVHATSKNNYGVVNGFKFMLNEGGVKSLWRGNGINVIKIAPETAIKFMAYEQIKTWFRGEDPAKELHILERLCSGSLAGCISQTAIYPMEVLKTRLALRKTGQFNGIFDCAMKVYKNEGIRMFYRGYVPNIIGIIPYAGIDLAVYETLKKTYRQKTNGQDPGILALLGCGTISSTCGQLSSYPLALIRTKLQAQGAKGQDTLRTMFTKIVKQDGFFGLYRGLAPNFMKVIPAVSISYVVYEHSRDALGVKSG